MTLKRVITGIDWDQPPISFLFTAVVTISGVWIYWRSFPAVAEDWMAVLFFAILVTMAECMHVRLPHVDGYVSVGSAVCLAALYYMGGPRAAIASSLGTLAANVFFSQIPLDAALFNGGQLAITAYVSGLVWTAVGGRSGIPIPFPAGIYPVLASMATYAFLNVSLGTLGIALAARKSILDTWIASVRWVIPNYAALGPLGVLASEICHSSLSVWGILLLWVPLLFARYSFQQYWEIRKAHLATIEALAIALDARDPLTHGHSERVAFYAEAMATHLKMTDAEIEQIRYAGILHDIGKIGISDFVLNKRGSLSTDEFALIQGHPGIGADMVRSINFLQDVGRIIRHHHEHFNGCGYPDRLQGETIPLGARIIAVADAYDAMTCDRVYRQGMSPEEAMERLVQGSGTQFDPDLVDAFLEVWDKALDGGRLAPRPARNTGLGELVAKMP